MTIEIACISRLLDAVGSTKFLDQREAHVRLWFRGHGNSNYKLEPGVYRSDFAKDEDERKLKERHLSQDFQALSAPLLPSPKTDAETYFIQQHYRMPTRLLDWSLNPLAALFFAVEKGTDDGSLFVLDAYQLTERGLCTPRAVEVRRAMSAIFTWNDFGKEGEPLWPSEILTIRPFNIDPRITSQRGCFTFHPPVQPQLDPNQAAIRQFVVPGGAKASLRKEIELLGFDEFTIYGDLDHLAARLGRAYT